MVDSIHLRVDGAVGSYDVTSEKYGKNSEDDSLSAYLFVTRVAIRSALRTGPGDTVFAELQTGGRVGCRGLPF